MQLISASDHISDSSLCLCLHKSAVEAEQALGKQNHITDDGCQCCSIRRHARQCHQCSNIAGAEDQVQRLWHKQLQAVFNWLLPEYSAETHTSDKHGPASTHPDESHQPVQSSTPSKGDAESVKSMADPSASRSEDEDELKDEGFDVAELYAAVKPSGNEPQLPQNNPKLRPTLRPYQRRAAAWMVARETGLCVCSHTLKWHCPMH